jgi:serine/threonine protein kinase
MLETYRNNPHVIDLLDSDLTGATKYLVLEYSELGSLEQYITNRVHPKHVMRWMRQVIAALRPIHRRGDWHRDIKPANLLLFKDPNGRVFVKISDFGLGQRIDNPSGPMTHSPYGTKGYIDPVAETSGVYSTASDIFSLARSINELLTGNRNGGLYPIDVPIDLQLLLNEMTRMTRDRRPSADDIYYRLTEMLEPKNTNVPQVTKPVSVPWGTILLGAGAAILGVLSNANTWDSNVSRWRNSKGEFASGWLG